MSARSRYFTRSARVPATLFAIVLVLVVALTVLWNVVLSRDYLRMRELAARAAETEGGAFHWTFIAIGSTLFVAIIVLIAILGFQLFGQIKLMNQQSMFIATVTHELNSPLASIKLYAQTLRNPDLAPAERARFLDIMLADIERLRTLIANVLRAAQVEAARLSLVREAVDLRDYLVGYVAEVTPAIEKRTRGGSIRLEAAPAGLIADVDPPVFRQVLDNLVDNAIKYAGSEPPRIEISVSRAGDEARIDFRDHGIGIPRSELKAIFDRFRRVEEVDAAHARQQGTGLGLSIARSLVELHGGKIEADSEGLGRGTTLRIALPVVEAEAVEGAEAA